VIGIARRPNKPCTLAAMTISPFRGLLVIFWDPCYICVKFCTLTMVNNSVCMIDSRQKGCVQGHVTSLHFGK